MGDLKRGGRVFSPLCSVIFVSSCPLVGASAAGLSFSQGHTFVHHNPKLHHVSYTAICDKEWVSLNIGRIQ